MGKRRLSASIDAEVLAAAEAAVEAGRAPTLSAWVEDALSAKVERERTLAALGEALEAADAEFGALSEDEIRAVERRARANAIVVRPRDVA
ncbi:hypothetical protein LRS13_19635 [Svornostia abyssi]|uniref:Uncharacterized protein n=1 Tax=Svornostia abyssi TaxID=2898438 RepID=A0ABY5PDX5_9ACTN|nr:hypothetical protein LRS13_19635 [Parviterribacteraceae bacterium J379]